MKRLKSPKTTKRLAALSAAFFVGSVATFAADVDVGTNAETRANAVSNKTGANDVKKVDATTAVERVKELGGTLERDEDGRVV